MNVRNGKSDQRSGIHSAQDARAGTPAVEQDQLLRDDLEAVRRPISKIEHRSLRRRFHPRSVVSNRDHDSVSPGTGMNLQMSDAWPWRDAVSDGVLDKRLKREGGTSALSHCGSMFHSACSRAPRRY